MVFVIFSSLLLSIESYDFLLVLLLVLLFTIFLIPTNLPQRLTNRSFNGC